jgi:hypothetical protein
MMSLLPKPVAPSSQQTPRTGPIAVLKSKAKMLEEGLVAIPASENQNNNKQPVNKKRQIQMTAGTCFEMSSMLQDANSLCPCR